MHSAGLYGKWLNDVLPNGTACLNNPRKILVQEPFSIQGLWVRLETQSSNLTFEFLCRELLLYSSEDFS